MQPKYFRPYLVYHKNHDENNPVMILYGMSLCYTNDSAKSDLIEFANKFLDIHANSKYKIKVVDGFPYIIRRLGLFKEVIIGYSNIGHVYSIGDNEYSYLGFVIKRVGNTFRIYDSKCEKFIGLSTIDIDEMKALNEALNMVDNIFHSFNHIKYILSTETKGKIDNVFK